MKVLAINSSPKMEMSNTSMILNPFLEGMKEAGADVDLIYTGKLNIKPCACESVPEFECWIKTPGVCPIDDDMKTLYPKIDEADIFVFASPVYVDAVNGSMKNFVDRMLPRLMPFIEIRDGHCRHCLRGDDKPRKMALVSNSGFWEMDNFDPLVVFMKAFSKNASTEFAGALLRPHGPILKGMLEMGAPVGDVLEAANNAGHQLIEKGAITQETLDNISRELIPRDEYLQFVNGYFKESLDSLEK